MASKPSSSEPKNNKESKKQLLPEQTKPAIPRPTAKSPQIRVDGGGDDGDNWWESWEQRRRVAVAQVLCYVSYAICIFRMHYRRQCADVPESRMVKKRKVCAWEREFESLGEAIGSVAEAIREGNVVMEQARQRVYSEAEVFAELMNIGVEQHVRYSAYTFLVKDPARVRAFFGYPVESRKDYLLQMMNGPQDP